MFNKDTFFAHKQGIRGRMEENLIWDKYHNTLKHKSSVETTQKSIEILFDDKPEDVLNSMATLNRLLLDGVKVDMYEISETPYCTKYMKGVRYRYETHSIRESISDRQVETAMRHLIHKKINADAGQRVSNIDCRVMNLFKAGKIDWPTVIESHKGDCSL